MNCREAQLLIGADPDTLTPELEKHLEACPECRRFREEMTTLNARIRLVMQSPPQAPLAEGTAGGQSSTVTPLRRRRATPVWSGWAMAASLLVAFGATLLVWALRPTPGLAHEVVAHVQDEPASWGSTQPVAGQRLEDILHAAGVELAMDSRRVVYAQSCEFRGHHVPHLVVSTSRGPVTVLVLRYEQVNRRQSFHENGMSGVLVPAPHGSVAVLAQGDTNIDEVAMQIRKDVRWLD